MPRFYIIGINYHLIFYCRIQYNVLRRTTNLFLINITQIYLATQTVVNIVSSIIKNRTNPDELAITKKGNTSISLRHEKHGLCSYTKLRYWFCSTDLGVVLLASVKLVTGHDVIQVASAENCHSVSGQHHINHVIYALVVYTRLSDEQKDKRLSPEPKHVRLAHNNCDIL